VTCRCFLLVQNYLLTSSLLVQKDLNAFSDRDRGMLVHSLGAFSDMQVLFTSTKVLMQVLLLVQKYLCRCLLVQKYLVAGSVQKHLLAVVDMQAAEDESYTVTTCVTSTKAQILTRLLVQKYKF
jgi:hypothetical protein